MSAHWRYCRSDGCVEIGRYSSTMSNALHGHFHDEAQIVAVLEGWRRFLTPYGAVVCDPGQIAVIPAGVVHAASGSARSRVVNLYVAPAAAAVRGFAAPRVMDGRSASTASEILEAVGACRRQERTDDRDPAAAMVAAVAGSNTSMRRLADAFGYSRDGFIRAFSRAVGLTPAQYRLACRLTAARSLLRDGAEPAQAAYAGAFSDQSHLGRMFLRAYGATPAAYRASVTG